MALIKCPECGGTVSDKAVACIHCGFPLQSNPEEPETYSVVVSSECATIQTVMNLSKIANVSADKANKVLSNPGSVIMSGVSLQTAQAVSSQLSAAGCKTNVIKDTLPDATKDSADSVPSNQLVFKINKYKTPRKDRPCIEASWMQEFSDVSLLFPGGSWKGVRYYWKNDESNNAPFSTVSLFNFKKVKLGTYKVSEVQCMPNIGNIFIWLTQDVEKLSTAPVTAVLGDVDSVPTVSINLNGSFPVAVNQAGVSVPVCPKCGSTSIQIVKQGFGAGKAAAGALLLGPIGLAAGAIGSGNIQRVCANCGHKF